MAKITRINAFQVEARLAVPYIMSGGRHYASFDSTIVEIRTEDGLSGWGEISPLSASYMPAYAAGARSGIKELAPHLLGQDALAVRHINQVMDAAMQGHPYVKSAIDIACWDQRGKAWGATVNTILGGGDSTWLPRYRAISKSASDLMAQAMEANRALGHRRFQLKVGGDSSIEDDISRIRAAHALLQEGETLVADANGGWQKSDAIRIANAVGDLDVYLEQPCASYEESLSVRRRTSLPFILDESIDSIAALERAIRDDAADMVNLKFSRVGGITRMETMRDLCVANGIPMIIEDAGGTDIISSAIIHFALSIPEPLRTAVALPNSKTPTRTSTTFPVIAEDGHVDFGALPGLGITPDTDVLGTPIFSVGD